jgi:predicted dehydrogenase
MLDDERPSFIDVITPPDSHQSICELAGRRGVHVLCQKPLAPSLEQATAIVAQAERAGIRLMAHDNFRFQPWHQELRRLHAGGTIGRLQSIACRTRLGDGWGERPYAARQPYFRAMPRLLVFETGVHFIDVFRALAGEVRQVYARLRRLNPVIAGEDTAVVLFDFESGASGLWDASRYHESLADDPRYTFGQFFVEGERGSLRLEEDGRILVHLLGQPARPHGYAHGQRGFAGDCCYRAMRHFIDRVKDGAPFETEGRDYLRTLAVQEAVYQSAAADRPVAVAWSVHA